MKKRNKRKTMVAFVALFLTVIFVLGSITAAFASDSNYIPEDKAISFDYYSTLRMSVPDQVLERAKQGMDDIVSGLSFAETARAADVFAFKILSSVYTKEFYNLSLENPYYNEVISAIGESPTMDYFLFYRFIQDEQTKLHIK